MFILPIEVGALNPKGAPVIDVVAVPVFKGALEKLKAGAACDVDPKPNPPVEDAILVPIWKPPVCWGAVVVPNENGAALLVKVAGPEPKENEEFEGAGLKY